MNTDQSGTADRWYYNATIVNGDSATPQPARFQEQRLVPLLNECSEYYVALARLSVQGVTANFPILRPAVLVPPSTALPATQTDYWVGLRWVAFANVATSAGVEYALSPVGYSNLLTTNLVLPVTPGPSTPESVSDIYSVRDVEDSLTASFQKLYSLPTACDPNGIVMTYTYPAPFNGTNAALFPAASTFPTAPLLSPPVAAHTEEGSRFLRASIDKTTYKLSLQAPVNEIIVNKGVAPASLPSYFETVEVAALDNPFLTPTNGVANAPPSTILVQTGLNDQFQLVIAPTSTYYIIIPGGTYTGVQICAEITNVINSTVGIVPANSYVFSYADGRVRVTTGNVPTSGLQGDFSNIWGAGLLYSLGLVPTTIGTEAINLPYNFTTIAPYGLDTNIITVPGTPAGSSPTSGANMVKLGSALYTIPTGDYSPSSLAGMLNKQSTAYSGSVFWAVSLGKFKVFTPSAVTAVANGRDIMPLLGFSYPIPEPEGIAQALPTYNNVPTLFDDVKWMCVPFFSDKLLELLPMPTYAPSRNMNAVRVITPYWRPRLPLGSYAGVNATTPDPGLDFTGPPLFTYGGEYFAVSDPVTLQGQTFYALDLSPHTAESVELPSALQYGNISLPNPAQPAPYNVVLARQCALTTTTIQALQWTQEQSAQSSWSVYTGLAITSNNIPAYEEAYGLNVLGSNEAPSAGASSTNIIFDIDLAQDELHQIQGGIGFTPTVFRYAKLRGGPLNNMDIQFWLRKKNGQFVPWMMDAGGTISAKLMFTRAPY